MARHGAGLYEAKNGSWKLDCWIHGQRILKSFGCISEKLARELAMADRWSSSKATRLTRVLPSSPSGFGSWRMWTRSA